ncbi:RHS repeat-associated core domain-containing protein [Aliikangiella sp. IMCC44359]|uniref:RHS repeat-associated core domain-containing protein n=1 Tax=Aliikangiella sp. IMCC44359 TaxID=3459125 RepID=UPI00403B2BF7
MKILNQLLVSLFLLCAVVVNSSVNAAEYDESKQVLVPIGVSDITIFIPVVSSVSQTFADEAMGIDNGYDFSWSEVNDATYYEVIITDENGKKTVVKVTGLQLRYASFPLGTNQVSVRACNASDQCGLPVVLIESLVINEQITYQHTDFLGSPSVETDTAASVVSRSHYEPFGKRLEGKKEGIGFTGHLEDEELELTYMQARYYDPLIGRFYSNDPVGFDNVHNFNRYTYGNNNPYKYVDPDGEVSITAVQRYTGTIGDQQLKWGLNIKLETSKVEYASNKANKYAAKSIKGLTGLVIKNEVKEKFLNTPTGPKGDGADMSSVVEIDTKLEAQGLRESSWKGDFSTSPEEFTKVYDGLSKENKAKFKAVHGQSAYGMVREAKAKYNKSLDKKTDPSQLYQNDEK